MISDNAIMMKQDPAQLLLTIAQLLSDKKGYNIVALDVRGISTWTDYFLFAEGSVSKHVIALARAVVDYLHEKGEAPLHVEGVGEGDWVVIDCLNLVIHLLTPGMRSKYRLEEVWQEGKIFDIIVR